MGLKPHNPGCSTNDCCNCVPITERVDEFSSLWKCFLGLPNGYGLFSDGGTTAYSSISSGWTVSGGQLIYSRPSGMANEDPISADAVRLAVPYSTELILEVAELNIVSGDQATLMIHQCDGGDGTTRISNILQAGIVGSVSPTINRFVGSTNGSQSYTNPVTAVPFTIWYKVQVDTDGIRHWLWIDGTKPTVSGSAWGTKQTVTPPSFTGSRKRYWAINVRNYSGSPRANWAKFNRLEIREWDHTSVTMPDPDNP